MRWSGIRFPTSLTQASDFRTMGWTTTTFQRETLYGEVWAEPVRTVATRYAISDAGLRKICRKLGVPVPPLGYWAKVAAGKKTRVITLPTEHRGAVTHERRIFKDENQAESDRRRTQLLVRSIPNAWPEITVRTAIPDLHTVVQRTGARMGPRSRLPNGLYESNGHDVFVVCVSELQKERALCIADAMLRAAMEAGAKLVPGIKSGIPVHLDVMGQFVGLHVEEEVTRAQREPTVAEKARQARESWYRPDLSVYAPTGKLKLSLVSDNKYSPFLTIGDGVRASIEHRLDQVTPRLWERVAQRVVAGEMRAEEHERWRQRCSEREAWEAARRNELERLKKTEEFAQRWRRAAELRSYANALERVGKGPTAATANQSLAEELKWVRNAADWLDPLVSAHWPVLDGQSKTDDDVGDFDSHDDAPDAE